MGLVAHRGLASRPAMRVAIAGAGVFGLTAALELRRRGHVVVVCDPGPVPHPLAESTDMSKVVRMDYADAFYLELMDATFAGWRRWNQAWGEALYHEVGFLVLTHASMQPGGFEHGAFTQVQARGHAVERLDAAAIAARFPAWASGGYVDGYFNPCAGFAESGRVIERLAREVVDAGVELRAAAAVVGIDVVNGAARGVKLAPGASISADAVLVAAGSWTPSLLPHLGDRLWATAQTVLHFRPRRPERFAAARFPVWAAGIGADGWYGFPATRDGLVKVANHGAGRRMSPDGDRTAPAADEARFRAFLAGALPELADAPLAGSRVCLYSDSWDGNFLIDRDPACAGLFLACGGSGHGFKFAPSLGAIIADAVEGKENRWLPRFRWRARAAGTAARK